MIMAVGTSIFVYMHPLAALQLEMRRMATELRALIASGSVQLVRVSYLLDPANHKHFGKTPDGRRSATTAAARSTRSGRLR